MTNTPSTFVFESFELDEARCDLRKGGHPVQIDPTPLRLLTYLLENRDRVVSKQEIFEHVWPDTSVGEAALSSAIRHIRHALGEDAASQQMVVTLRRRGFRFVAEVVERPADDATSRRVDPPLPDMPSIVVLPFTNMSGDPEQEYFSDGITEDLTTELARNRLLFVISRNSAFMYKGERVNVEEVGRELGVRYVIEGSVRKADGQVRITAQLIDATTGGHLWSERYDRALSDIFALQSEIAEELLARVGGSGGEILRAEFERVARKPSGSLTAIDSAYRGLYFSNRSTRQDIQEARRLFERAIEIDPGYASAYGWLGGTYTVAFASGWSLDPKLLDRAEELARRALALDPTLPDGHLTLAFVNFFRDRPAEAITSAEAAVELGPNNEFAHGALGLALARSGRFVEGLQSIKRALRLNPRGPTPLLMMVAYVNWGAGRRAKAVELLERVRLANSDHITVRVALAAYYEGEGQHEKAVAAVREILRVRPDLTAEGATQLLPGLEAISDSDEFARYPDDLRSAGLP